MGGHATRRQNIHIPIWFSETGMTTRRCFREGPAYHWEEEEEKRRRRLNGESIKAVSMNGSRDQFNKFMYYGIKCFQTPG